MKHGIYYAYWEKEWSADYIKYVKKAAKLGFDILEIGAAPLPDYSEAQIKELKKCADDCGITLTAGYGPTYEHNMASADPAIRAGADEWYKKLFDVMGRLDIHLIGGALYWYWPVDYTKKFDKAQDRERSIAGVQRLSELAAPYGIDLGMEVLNRYENYILNTAEEGVAFVKEAARDNVWVMLDTYHMNIEETSIAGAIRTAGPLLGHFHTGECNRLTPGKGRIPWREIAEALRDIGYDKTVVMEPFVNMGGQVGKDIYIWHDLNVGTTEEELDEAARQAVIFQRYMLDWK